MRESSGSSVACRGFSLTEVLVALSLTVIIMMMAGQLLMSMKRSADRIWLNTEPRQLARRGAEYISHYVRTASDFNEAQGNPAAILTWLKDGNDNPIQVAHNNVTNANIADVGTDIICVGHPINNFQVLLAKWPGNQHASNADWIFNLGCPDSSANLTLFKQLTGYDATTKMSAPIPVFDSSGNWVFYQITNYLEGSNSDSCKGFPVTDAEIHIVANPGKSESLNPPSGHPGLVKPITMQLGVVYVSFRVRNGWLEQKNGVFNPNSDNPGVSFVPLLPNVEDLQIAWIFRDGTTWNSPNQQLVSQGYSGGVPSAGSSNDYDVLNVIGMRVTVTARSTDPAAWDPQAVRRRPSAEDHAQGSLDRLYHDSSTITALVRNRVLSR